MTATINTLFTRTQFMLLTSLLALVFSFSLPAEAASENIDLTINPADSSIEWVGVNGVTYSFYFDGSKTETKLTEGKSIFAALGNKRGIFTLTPGVHTVTAVGKDTKGVVVSTSAPTTFFAGFDVPKPKVGIPGGESASRNSYPFMAKTVSSTQIDLTFNCTVPNADHSCKIYQDGNLIKTFDVKSKDYGRYTTYSVKNLTPNTKYSFVVIEYAKKGSLPDKPRGNIFTYTPTLTLKTPSDTPVTCQGIGCTKTITVLMPNGGEQWDEGILNTVTWSPYGYKPDINPAKDVTAYLEKKDAKGNFVTIGKVQESGKASIHWVAGELNSASRGGDFALPGEGYYIRVVNNKTGATDRSDKSFTLLPKPIKIKVNGKENWVEISTVKTPITVSWETTPGVTTCQLSGMKGVSFSTVQPAKGSVTGLIEYQAYDGGVSYGVELQCVKNGTQIRESARLSVASVPQEEASLKIISPNGGETFDLNKQLVSEFDYKGLNSASFALYKNDKWLAWLGKDVNVSQSKNGTFSFIPSSAVTGLTTNEKVYKMYITGKRADGEGYIEDKSDEPFSFTAPVVCQAIGCTTDKIPPTAPTNMRATADSGSQITLKWNASTDSGSGVWGYRVKRSGYDGVFDLPNTSTIFVDTVGLKPATAYTYTITALDNAKEANESTPVTVTIKTLSAPTGYSDSLSFGDVIDDDSILIDSDKGDYTKQSLEYEVVAVGDDAWVSLGDVYRGPASVAHALSYEILKNGVPTNEGIATVGYGIDHADLYGNNSNGYNKLAEGEAYRMYVSVNYVPTTIGSYSFRVNGIGYSNVMAKPTLLTIPESPKDYVSDAVIIARVGASQQDTTAPTTPTNFRVTASTTSSITLGWNASTDAGGVKGYNIYRDISTTPRNTTLITSTNFTDTGLTQGTGYKYAVESVDVTGNKSTKATVTANTPNQPTSPVAQVIPTCTLTANKSSYTFGETITYTWTSKNATYAGWMQDTSGKDHLMLPGDKLSANGTQAVPASVTGNPPVTLTVGGPGGTGSCSLTVAVTSPTPVVTVDKTVPSVPVSATVANLSAVSGAGWGVDLSWGASTDNVGVTGYIVKSIAPTASTLTTTTGKTYKMTGLVLGSEYTVSVQAKDARGNLGPARVVKFKLAFTGMATPPTLQIISNTVDTTVQKVVAQVPSTAPLTGAENTTKIETLTALMNKLIELKAMMASVKSSQ